MKSFRRLYVSLLCCVVMYVLTSVSTLYATVTLYSSINVTETYTDNLFFESKQNKQDDFGTFVSPSLTLEYVSADVVLSGTYTGIAQFYVNNSSANAYSHNSNFRIDLPFLTKRYKGLEVQLIETFNFSPQLDGYAFAGDPEDQETAQAINQGGIGPGAGGINQFRGSGFGSGVGNQGVFTSRSRGNNSFQNRAGVIVRYALSPRWTTNARYLNRYTTFVQDDLNDSLSHTLGAGLGYNLSPRTQLRGNYSANINNISGGDTVVTHSVTGGVNHILSPTMNMNVNGGISFTESVKRVNFTTNSSITKRFDPGSIRLGYNQSVTNGGGLGTSGVLTQNGVLSLSYPLARRVSGFVQGGVSRNKSLSGNSVNVRSYQGQVGVSVVLLPWLSGNLSYSHIKQKSKGTAIAARTATVNQGFVGLTASLPQWRILR